MKSNLTSFRVLGKKKQGFFVPCLKNLCQPNHEAIFLLSSRGFNVSLLHFGLIHLELISV
jgi:hypothetical protein